MNAKSLGLVSAIFLSTVSLGRAQITINSSNVVYINGTATPSTQVPLGNYQWIRGQMTAAQFGAPPNGGIAKPEDFARVPLIDPVMAQTAMDAITVPPEFKVSVWSTPPLVVDGTAIAAAPDGTVYVAVDSNAAGNGFDNNGRVVRLRDTNGDGVADEAKPFVLYTNTPRGVLWDHDHLIVLGHPDITAWWDRDGDGIAEEKKVLVSGIAWPLDKAFGDHTTQNIEAGIDGWIYVALGDIGVFGATGSDGRKLQMQGGGVLRFRPDGSGLEIWGTGTRNNYGVVVGPQLDVFTRDNTNDGGGWDVRFHHLSGMSDHGYPSLWRNFQEEMIAPLADFGGGSGVGSMWLDEPGIPAKWNDAPYTADYGQAAVFLQRLTQRGATFDITNDPFIETASAIDEDVDGNSAIYVIARRAGGGVYRVSLNNFTPAPLPNFDRITAAELVQVLAGPSNVRRLEAQRAILRRKAELGAQVAPMLQALAADRTKPLNNRIAALFTDKQLRGAQATAQITQLVGDPTIAAWALRALGDDLTQARSISIPVVTAALRSADPRVRKEALITLARADSLASAPAMTPLLGDADPIVAHTAMQTLRSLRAVEASLAVVDSNTAPTAVRKGALMVLHAIHERRVTDALIQRVGGDQSIERRTDIVGALARLANTEAQWNGTWWSTRPSSVGPYYNPAPWAETPKILQALTDALNRAGPEETLAIGRQFARQGVAAGAAVSKFISFAETEPALVPQIAAYFSKADEIPANAIPVLVKAVTNSSHTANVRADAITALTKTADRGNWATLLPAVGPLANIIPVVRPGRVVAPTLPPIPDASTTQQMLVTDMTAVHAPLLQAATAALNSLLVASLGGDSNTINVRANALAQAEQALATARADAFARIQTSTSRFNAAQSAALVAQIMFPPVAAGRGGGGARGGAGVPPVDQARGAVINSARLDEIYPVLIEEAAKLNGDSSQLADAALLTISGRKFGAEAPRNAATRALDAGWADPRRRIQIMLGAVTARDTSRAEQIIAAAKDTDVGVARTAQYALQQLSIDPVFRAAASVGPKIAMLPVAAVLDAVVPARGNVARGSQLVRELGCVACHTTSSSEVPKGPPLNLVSGVLPRRALAEAILQPNKTIAQGFHTIQITRRSGGTITGFVVQEAADAVSIRDITTQQTRIPTSDIGSRARVEVSLMPEGLTGNLTVTEFASLLDYIESLGRATP